MKLTAGTVGGLLPIVSTVENGLFPKNKAEIKLTENAWYEISFDGSIFISVIHPYDPVVAMACMRSVWSSTNVVVQALLDRSNNISTYIKWPSSNTVKKVYVKGPSVGGSTRTTIIPLEISGSITVKVTSDDISGL